MPTQWESLMSSSRFACFSNVHPATRSLGGLREKKSVLIAQWRTQNKTKYRSASNYVCDHASKIKIESEEEHCLWQPNYSSSPVAEMWRMCGHGQSHISRVFSVSVAHPFSLDASQRVPPLPLVRSKTTVATPLSHPWHSWTSLPL